MHRGVPDCNAIADSYWSELSDSDDDAHAIVHPDTIADSYRGRLSYQDTDADCVTYSDGYYTADADVYDLL